ncbi:SorA family sulfite dehydrogenase catalytic subunit [Methylobacillus sp.]|jgi:DMSO/TMAO reductase YedYZ molybdopterin-dependent catalytic subunit|uniref:SorA family sulfite dehydrogenase catalytic subunit n=1 Tax=Methylobacillus sp. TaxID=56818 RepID=UPI002FE0D95D
MKQSKEEIIRRRRLFLQAAGAGLIGLMSQSSKSWAAAMETLSFGNGERELIAYPQKRKLMRITTRPPHLETPFEVFDEGVITPNDAFFVRYHLANFPLSINPETYQLKVGGNVNTPLSLSLADLKAMPTEEVVAVNQCSGNSRGYSVPRVFGAQLGNGSMGNARWVGVPVKTVLEKAGVKAGTVQVAFNGLDKPVLPSTPDFVKTLEIDHALNGEPLIAWEMNGEELPFLNGYPIKLIVPGYFGTYWVKHLSQITLLDKAFDGHDSFFMNTAYRLPDNDCACVEPATTADKTKPIGKLKVRSFITNLNNQQQIKVNETLSLRGIAFDGGSGIREVEVSSDGGQHWAEAKLGKDLGRFSFRAWSILLKPSVTGALSLMVRATANSGEQQPMVATWNPGGYARNVVETLQVNVI